MRDRLNFAPVPFPRRQNALLLLWALNLLLLVGLGGALWHWNTLRDQNHQAHSDIDTLKERQSEIAAENQTAVSLLEAIDTKTYRKQVELFHGAQLAFQTHWGKLLDELAKVLPEDVRLSELRPTSGRDDAEKGTRLLLVADARHKDAQLAFIETLQKHPGFADVTFESEHYGGDGVALSFEISFSYLGGKSK